MNVNTCNFNFRSSLAHIEAESIEVGAARARSTPVNMPSISKISSRPLVPVLIESGSCSKFQTSINSELKILKLLFKFFR